MDSPRKRKAHLRTLVNCRTAKDWLYRSSEIYCPLHRAPRAKPRFLYKSSRSSVRDFLSPGRSSRDLLSLTPERVHELCEGTPSAKPEGLFLVPGDKMSERICRPVTPITYGIEHPQVQALMPNRNPPNRRKNWTLIVVNLHISLAICTFHSNHWDFVAHKQFLLHCQLT